MSRRPGAPYDDSMSPDESLLTYEGHDAKRQTSLPDPKMVDQPRSDERGHPTQNGEFAQWVDDFKDGKVEPARFRVYEKLRAGIWTDRGMYFLEDYRFERSGPRFVFKFVLHQTAENADNSDQHVYIDSGPNRQIPSWVKQAVFKRDHGKCVMCGAINQLHFDHDLPFSKGGTSITPENVRILCARHNLAKSAKIE